MLPVVAGAKATRLQILLYTLPMAAAAVAPWPLGLAGPLYGIAAGGLSLVFLVLALRVLANRATEPAAMKPEKQLFAFSILYLFALFGALVADRWLLHDATEDEVRRRQRSRAIIMAVLLGAFVVLVYAITIAKMGLYSS